MREYRTLSTMLYQLTKPVGYSIDGDIEYYEAHLKGVKGKILEAGVGTGRMLIPFLQKGFAIEGVDLSEKMLSQCRLNLDAANLSATLYQADLTELTLPETYEAILMPTGSFGLLPREKVTKVLASFYAHLQTGGQFILDLEFPTHFVPNVTNVCSFELEPNRTLRLTSTSKEIDWLQQKTSSINQYELIEEGLVKTSEVADFILYWYGLQEFEYLLTQAGFTSIRYTRGYEGSGDDSLVTFFAWKEK